MSDLTKVSESSLAQDSHAESRSEIAHLLNTISRMASDPATNVETMIKLINIAEGIEKRKAEKDFNAAMALAQNKIAQTAVIRNKKNTHTGSTYADLFAIADAALPIAHENGFGLSFSECAATQPGCIGIAAEVTHAGGFSKRYEYNIPEDVAGSGGKVNKTKVQAYGSTMTYGRRYAICGIFNIAVKDNDGNANRPPEDTETISPDQVKVLDALIKATGADKEKFLGIGGFSSLNEIPAKQFGTAKTMLEKKLKAVAKKATEQRDAKDV